MSAASQAECAACLGAPRGASGAILGTIAFLAVPGTVAGLGPWSVSGWRMGRAFLGAEPLRWVGAALIAAGVVGLCECFARFALVGLGTPAPAAPPERLVVSGLYRRVRNPMYVAVVASILGQALLLGSAALLVYGAVIWLMFHLFVIAYEEPTLRRSFGADYEAFRAAVPRWIPRLTPWRGS
jgi:protein-S-isoprenylcysteine O-methyltransferase Ste14